MEKVCEFDKCTACRACVHACPKQAIKMVENEYGALLPQIDNSKCVDCGLCKKVCQAHELDTMNEPQKCYAVWTKDDEDRKICSSGGVSTGFARKVIKDGGIVFGTAYVDKLKLAITEASTEDEILKFRGSKYVQCDTDNSYPNVKKYLEAGKEVLYVGTPCQIMGLRKYLRKEYANLLTVDIICHGVPPFKMLKEHISLICPSQEVTRADFRGKYDFRLTVYNRNEKICSIDRFEDCYFTSFLDGLNYRENCYTCNLAQKERASDITIGDFWGLNRSTMKQKYTGRISTVLINTSKGAEFFESIKNHFWYEERLPRESIDGNDNLRQPTIRHEKRDIFLQTYLQRGLQEAYIQAGIAQKVKKVIRSRKIKNMLWYRGIRKIKHLIIK